MTPVSAQVCKGVHPPTEPRDRLAFLLNAAAWQDSLLQAYRTLLVSSQTLLLALGTALFVAGLTMSSEVQVYVVSALVITIAIGGACANWRLQRVVRSRSDDVDFWHEEILLHEKLLPLEERLFTWFKLRQQGKERGRVPNDPRRETSLDQLSVPDLTLAGLGYTRNVIDRQLVGALLGGWALLSVGTAGYVVAVAIAGVP
jgi:hypothetical protein